VEDVDIAVVGAGPAGSTLAALLAARGHRVALIDRDLFPRDKLCGEFLSYDALPVVDALGVLPQIDAHGAPRIESCRIVGTRRTYEFAFPHAARGVSRLLLDDLLFRAAITRGAEPLEGWTAAQIANDVVTIEREGETRTLRTRVLAGAWGRWGRFDQQLGRAFVRDRSHRNFGFKRHYTPLAASRPPQATIELYSFRRGYLGASAIENGITNICGLVHASRLTGHKGRWESFVDEIRAEEPALEALYARHEPAQEGFLSSEPVIFRARSAVEGGVFMIGDASGVIDPLTGNGMAMAIQSALLAATHIARLLGGDDRAQVEDAYRAAHRAMFAHRIAWARRSAKMLSRPKLVDALMPTPLRHTPLGAFLLRRTRAPRDEISRLTDRWFA
jgi:flavin-dependent dehydrogenase